jgi:hypothetical protein
VPLDNFSYVLVIKCPTHLIEFLCESSDHLKGVECNPPPLGRHNVEVGKCYLAEPWDKFACLLCAFFLIVCVHKSSFQAT